MARIIAVALAVSLASIPAARAAGAPGALGVVAVGDPPAGPSAELADLTRSFQGILASSYRGVVSPDELRQRMEGRSATASLSELERALNGSNASFRAGDYERGVQTLRAVVSEIEKLPPSEQAFGIWSRAMMRLARGEGSLGKKGEAREAMERLLRADPAATADPDLYPPSFVKQVDQVRAELRAKPRRKLVVKAGGAPARVFVEGRFVGDAPITVTVSPGPYRVAGVLKDVFSAPTTIDLATEDQTVTLDFSVAEILRPAAGPGLAIAPAKRATSTVAAGAALQLDRIFALSLVMDGDVRYVVGSVYDVQRGSLSREGRVRLSRDVPPQKPLSALATFLQTGETSTLVITQPEREKLKPQPKSQPIAEAREPEQQQPFGAESHTLLKWSPVATGALAVVLGGVSMWQGFSAKGKYSDAKSMLLSNGAFPNNGDRPAYDGLVSDGDGAKQTATITGVAAGTALAATAVLSYFSYKKTGEVGPFRF